LRFRLGIVGCRDLPAIFKSACFTNQFTMPGLAPQQETAVTPPGFFLASVRTISRSA